jgi:hypothetical protein
MRYSGLLMLKIIPQFRHFASTLPGLGIDDTMSLPYPITCSDEILKAGNAPVPCQFLSCFILSARVNRPASGDVHDTETFRERAKATSSRGC